MPIYEYACRGCGHEFDALQKVSDAALRKCPECGALKLQRLVSAPQFRLKGAGWYETDFKQNGKRRLAESGDSAAAPDASAGEKTAKADKPDKADKAGKTDQAATPAKAAASAKKAASAPGKAAKSGTAIPD